MIGNLPPEQTGFFGRKEELAHVKRLLALSPVVTVTGPGGVGKTSLAVRAATRARRAFDAVWRVECDRITEPASPGAGDRGAADQLTGPAGTGSQRVARAVACACGLAPPVRDPALPVLLTEFAQRRVLLLLDNCEPLVDEVAALAHTMLRSCPHLRILATSQEPLRIDGEVSLCLAPMPVPAAGQEQQSPAALSRVDSVALFLHRAALAVPAFTLTTGNRRLVARLCRELDGLPLAIELAAAALPALPALPAGDDVPSDLHRWLQRHGSDDPAEPAHPPDPDSCGRPVRHRSLQACVAWSHTLCSPTERLWWARLSVFEGGFELDAAEEICAAAGLDAGELLDVVAALLDKSVLLRDEPGPAVRYRMPAAVRAFGLDRLRTLDERARLRGCHRDWYRTLARRAALGWCGERQPVWRDRVDREQPAIAAAFEIALADGADPDGADPDGADPDDEPGAALELAAALTPYWISAGRSDIGRCWLDRALARSLTVPVTVPAGVLAEALLASALLAGWQGDRAAAGEYLRRAGEQPRPDAPAGWPVRIGLISGLLALLADRLTAAADGFGFAADAARTDPALSGHLLLAEVGLVLTGALRGESRPAVQRNREAAAQLAAGPDTCLRGWRLWAFGLAAWRAGAASEADALVGEALGVLFRAGDRPGAAHCLEVLAWTADAAGNSRRAATLLAAAAAADVRPELPAIAFPGLVPDHQRCAGNARRALGGQAFRTAQRHGAQLSTPQAVRLALDGGSSPQVQAGSRPGGSAARAQLTSRERQVAELVARGLTNREIAARLVIAQRTAEGHVQTILVKLDLSSRAQIAGWVASGP